jgi:hypothetical protein
MPNNNESHNSSISVEGNAINSSIILGNGNTIIHIPSPSAPYSPFFTISSPPKDFTGREYELVKLISNFKNGVSISGITGGGGIGKTALARLLAKKLSDNYPDAQLEIDLQGASYSGQTPLTPKEAMQKILQPFYPDQNLPQNEDELKRQYTSTFSQKRVLLLLDNASNITQIRSLLPPIPSGAIVTSRTYFSLSEFDLHPLKLGFLTPSDARSLLLSVAPRLREEDGDSLDVVAKLCGFLPLALRVAASIIDIRADWEIKTLILKLQNEHSRLGLLKSPEDSDLDLQSSLSLSYAVLDENSKRLFRGLGIFPSSFDLDAVCKIWGENKDICDMAIGDFLRRNLVDYDSASIFPYKLHDLTRLFAEGELLKSDDESLITIERHANYYFALREEIHRQYIRIYNELLKTIKTHDAIQPHFRTTYARLKGEDPFWKQKIENQESVKKIISSFPDIESLEVGLEMMSFDEIVKTYGLRRGEYFLVEEIVHPDSSVAHKMLKDIELPDLCIVSSLIRNEAMILPRGTTTLEVNDRVLIMAHASHLNQLGALFKSGN